MHPRRYPTDTTDEEQALFEPLLPIPACQTRRGGRPEKHHRRDVFDAIRYATGMDPKADVCSAGRLKEGCQLGLLLLVPGTMIASQPWASPSWWVR